MCARLYLSFITCYLLSYVNCFMFQNNSYIIGHSTNMRNPALNEFFESNSKLTSCATYATKVI